MAGHNSPLRSASTRHSNRPLDQLRGLSSVDLRDINSGEVLAVIDGPAESIGGAAFSRDGSTLAVGSALMPLRLWNIARRQSVDDWEGSSESTRAICSSPTTDEFALADSDGIVRIWGRNESVQEVEELSHRQRIEVMRYSPNGSLLAIAGISPTVWVWSVRNQRLHARLSAHENWILGLDFSPDSSLLATGGDDGHVRIWRVADLQLISEAPAHEPGVRCVAFAPDGILVASAGAEPIVRLWDSRSGKLKGELACSSGLSMCVSFRPSGGTLAISDAEEIQLIDLADRSRSAPLVGHIGWVIALSWSPDGSLLTSVDNCGYTKLWSARGEPLATFSSLPEGGWASISADGTVELVGEPGNYFWWVAKMWRFGLRELEGLHPS